MCKSWYRSGTGWETGLVGRRGPAGVADAEPRISYAGQAARHTCNRYGQGAHGRTNALERGHFASCGGCGPHARKYRAVRSGGFAGQRHVAGKDSQTISGHRKTRV